MNMAAKDYKICLAMFDAYFAKISKKNPNLMLEDRRKITDDEIFNLIEWRLKNHCIENKTDTMVITVGNKPLIELKAHGALLDEIKKITNKEEEK